jgi:DNA-directed RNA polymerase subunit K/omega
MQSELSWNGDLLTSSSPIDPTDVITPKDERRSGLFLTRFEVAKIVGERAKQIASNAMLSASTMLMSSSNGGGATPERSQSVSVSGTPVQQPSWRTRLPERSHVFQLAEKATDPTARAVDPVMMAKYELVEKRITMVIKRTFPDGRCETIPVQELEVDPCLLDMRL